MGRPKQLIHLAAIGAFLTAPMALAQMTPVAVIQTPVPVDVGRAAFSHDGKLVATIDQSGTYATLWDAKTGQKVVTLSGEPVPIISPLGLLVFSVDDRYVAAFDDGKVNSRPPVVWECETGHIVVWKAGTANQLKLSIGDSTPADVRAWSRGSRGKIPALLGGAKGEPRVVSKIALSADGSKLAVARRNPERSLYAKQADSIEVWPLRASQSPISFATGLYRLESLVFSHDVQWLGAATQSKSETGKYTQILVGDVRLWHVSDGVETKLKIENTQPAEDHEWSATNVAFSADDKQLVADVFRVGELPASDCPPGERCGDLESFPYDVRTTFFDLATGRMVNSTPLGKSDSSEVEQRGFFWLSSDGRRAITMQEKLTLVNVLTGREVGTFKPPELRPYPGALDECESGLHAFGFAAFSNDGRQIAISDGVQLEIVEAKTGISTAGDPLMVAYEPNIDKPWQALTAAFSPSGGTLAVAFCETPLGNGQVRLYNTSKLQELAVSAADIVLTSLAFAPDGALLFTGGYDGAVRVWEAEHGSLVATLVRSIGGEWIVFTPDGLYDASANGASLLAWRLKGQIVLASELPDMRLPGLLSKLVSGEHPKPNKPLLSVISSALPHVDR
jgi:WD40 repeat protein